MTPKKQIIKITLHFNGFFMVFSVSFYAYFVSPLGMAHLKKQFIKIIFLLIFFLFLVFHFMPILLFHLDEVSDKIKNIFLFINLKHLFYILCLSYR